MKVIINADDCGKNVIVDEAILEFIQDGKLTSTTVMANMDDLDGAVKLYNQFHDIVSFGMHLNLTEGTPLSYNQELLDKGYFCETGGEIQLNTKPLRNKLAGKGVQEGLTHELSLQIEKVLDSGIRISHLDSHHHIHTSIMMLSVLPRLTKRYGINKIRRVRNYVPGASKVNLAMRNLWEYLMKIQDRAIISPDFFCSYNEWYKNGSPIFSDDTTIELMCHPGAGNIDEDKNLISTDFLSLNNVQLVNYNKL